MSDFQEDTIQRCPHDRANPYVMVNNNLIRDNSISPECRWLLIYLLTNDNGWVIKTEQLVNHLKGHKGYGRDRIREIIKEAIDAGYMKREAYLENNMTRYRYYLSEEPKFSNNFSEALNARAPSARAPEKPLLKNNHPSSYSEEVKKEQYKEKSAAPPPSAEASALCKFFIEKIKERNPKFKEPSLPKWTAEFDKMITEDKRDTQEIRLLIDWTHAHPFWKANCLSPEALRKHYDKLTMQRNASEDQERSDDNRRFCLDLKKKYPDRLKDLTITPKYAMNVKSGKDLMYALPIETFRNALCNMFGGRYEPNRESGKDCSVGEDSREEDSP